MECNRCPRRCKISHGVGFCGVRGLKVAKIMKHFFEEPCISGTLGSGAVFFSGCNLRCCYCQNMPVSHGCKGEIYSESRLADEILKLQDSGVHNVDFITAAHIVPEAASVLRRVKPFLKIPVIYNSSGYEGDIHELNGLVDVYLPDFKYFDGALAAKYSKAPDYPEAAKRTIAAMTEQVGEPVFENGLIKKGVIIRHLVLPGCRKDSMLVLDYIKRHFPSALVSIMSQYTPSFNRGPKELDRKVTSFEYNSVVDYAARLGLRGFMQDRSSATDSFTPDFD